MLLSNQMRFSWLMSQFPEKVPSIKKIILLGNPTSEDGVSAAHILAKAGFVFSEDELLWLDKMRNGEANKILLAMALRKHLIPYKKLASFKISIELLIAYANELLDQYEFQAFTVMMMKMTGIDKPMISTILYVWIARHGFLFTIDDIRKIQNIADKNNGATIPDISEGKVYQFTPKEIDTLCAATDAEGKIISAGMEFFKNKQSFYDHTLEMKIENSTDSQVSNEQTKETASTYPTDFINFCDFVYDQLGMKEKHYATCYLDGRYDPKQNLSNGLRIFGDLKHYEDIMIHKDDVAEFARRYHKYEDDKMMEVFY